MAEALDFQIDTMKFRLAVDNTYYSSNNTGRRYVRSTAQFRKDQIDSSQTVGDQSLAGWWTRGQLSFHMGAGIKYYDLFSADVILNRFRDCSAVDPWTPGQVSLAMGFTQVALAGVEDAVTGTYGGADGVFAKVGGNLKFVNSTVGATISPYDGGTVTAVTSSGTVEYVTTSLGNIGGGAGTRVYTNYAKNPDMMASGTAPTYAGGTVSVSTAADGRYSINTSGTAGITLTPALATLPASLKCRVIVETPSGQNVSYHVAVNGTTVIASTTATRSVASFTSTGTDSVVVTMEASGIYEFTEISVTDDPYASEPTPSRDSHWVWSGAANASKSTRSFAVGDLAPLWSPPTGRTFKRLWWAKGRLLAIDDQGKWYQLPTAGGAASEANDVFWTPNLGTTGWWVAESPAAIYISHGTDIYMVAPDSTGSVPTITTPVVAASLPSGETISTIFCYLGRLVICTNLGMRVAVVQGDGSLIYGPLAVEGDFSKTVRVAALRNLAYVVGTQTGESSPSIWTVNMIADIANLQPAYARLGTVASGTVYGAAITPDGKVMTWDGNGFFRTSTAQVADGWIETGFHRLGTLDPKTFQYVRVKTEGTDGLVEVSAILPDGTTALVGNVNAGTTVDLSLAAAVPNPEEYIGLKFELSSGATDWPILLGYQIKALPVPKRQRLIQVPLLLRDVITTANGRKTGREGDAWKNLQALEALESSKAIVSYEDFRTGETGTAYIDGVEFTGDIETSHRTREFGGIAYVELRVIS